MKRLSVLFAMLAAAVPSAKADSVAVSWLLTQIYDGALPVQCCYTNGAACLIRSASDYVASPATRVDRFTEHADPEYSIVKIPVGYSLDKWYLVKSGQDITAKTLPPTLDQAKVCTTFNGASVKVPRNGIPNWDTYMVLAPAFSWLKYDIWYYKNDGTDARRYDFDAGKTQIYTNEFAVMESPWTRNGYDFVGWSLSTDAAKAEFYAGDPVTGANFQATTNGVNLYAVWKPHPALSVGTYNPRFGSVSPSGDIAVAKGESLEIKAVPADGCRFDGWSDGVTNASRTVISYTNAVYWARFSIDEDALERDSFDPPAPAGGLDGNKTTVYFISNGGSGKMPPQTETAGATFALNTNVFENVRQFLGWSEDSSATAATFGDAAVMSGLSAGPLTLYAVWEVSTPDSPDEPDLPSEPDALGELSLAAHSNIELTGGDDWQPSTSDYGENTNGIKSVSSNAALTATVIGPGEMSYHYLGSVVGSELKVSYKGDSGSETNVTWKTAGEPTSPEDPVEVCLTNKIDISGEITVKWVAANKEDKLNNIVWTPAENAGDGSGGDTGETNETETVKAPIAYYHVYDGLVYDGNQQTGIVAIAGCTVSNNVATDAGTYSATVTLDGATAWSDGSTAKNKVVEWSIAKREYDMSGVTFADGVFVEDGTGKSIEVEGTLPGGVAVSYSPSNVQTKSGTYSVTAAFAGDTNNYETVGTLSATLRIIPAFGAEGDAEPVDGELAAGAVSHFDRTANHVAGQMLTLDADAIAKAFSPFSSDTRIQYSLFKDKEWGSAPIGISEVGTKTIWYRVLVTKDGSEEWFVHAARLTITEDAVEPTEPTEPDEPVGPKPIDDTASRLDTVAWGGALAVADKMQCQYDGFIADGSNLVGTVTLKLKCSVKSGVEKPTVTAKVLLADGTKPTYKAKEWTAGDGGSRLVTLTSTKAKDMTISFADAVAYGECDGRTVYLARNKAAEKAKDYSAIERFAKNYTAALRSDGADLGYLQISAKTANAAVTAKGVLPDATKISAKATLLDFGVADGSLCIPLVAAQKGKWSFAALVWIDSSTLELETETSAGWNAVWNGYSPSRFAETLALAGDVYAGGVTGRLTVSVPSLPGYYDAKRGAAMAAVGAASPDGLAVNSLGGGKFSVASSKPKKDKATKAWLYSGPGDAQLKLSYAARTGELKGSFKIYYDWIGSTGKAQHKVVTAKVQGIAVGDGFAGFAGFATVTETNPALKKTRKLVTFPFDLK